MINKQFFIIILFFLPYFPGTPYRLDVFLEISLILIYGVICSLKIFHNGSKVNAFLFLAALPLFFISFRLLADLAFDPKIIIYQIHIFAGGALYFSLRRIIRLDWLKSIRVLVLFGIITNMYALFQWLWESSPLVQILLELYGGVASSDYTGDFGTLSALEVMTKSSMTSIFTGKHTLAQFSLLILALSQILWRAKQSRRLAAFGIISSIVGGSFSFSKVFFFGLPIYMIMSIFFSYRRSLRKKLGELLILSTSVAMMSAIMYDSSYVLSGIFSAIVESGGLSLLDSRYGLDGYLTEKNYIFSDLLTWLFGQGADAGQYRMADNQYRSLILLGGIPYLILFIAPILYLWHLMHKSSRIHAFTSPLLSYNTMLFFAGIGVEVFWQPRIVTLWVFIVLVTYYANRNIEDTK